MGLDHDLLFSCIYAIFCILVYARLPEEGRTKSLFRGALLCWVCYTIQVVVSGSSALTHVDILRPFAVAMFNFLV